MSIMIHHPNNQEREPARTSEEISQRLSDLRDRTQNAAAQYRSELERLRISVNTNICNTNDTLRRNHQRELREIANQYASNRREFLEEIERTRNELNRELERETEQIRIRINTLENRIAAQSENDRRVADDFRIRMRNAWDALMGRTELEPFTNSHIATMETTNAAAEEAYRLEQYQAVTAIMVNSIALIGNWKNEAELIYEEWLEMKTLCEDVINYMHTAVNAAQETTIDCDGIQNRNINLSRYNQAAFAELESMLRIDDEKLTNSSHLSVEEMQSFLHALETDRQRVDGTIERTALIHCAYVRRLKTYKAICEGFEHIHYSNLAEGFAEGGFLNDIRIIFKNKYTGHKLNVSIRTPNYEYPQTNVDLTFIPGAAIDARLQQSLCSSLASSVTKIIGDRDPALPRLQHNMPYKNNEGLYQVAVGILYNA